MEATTESTLAIGEPKSSPDLAESRTALKQSMQDFAEGKYKEPEKADTEGDDVDDPAGSLKSQPDDKGQPVAKSEDKAADAKAKADAKAEEAKTPQQKNAERKGLTWEKINAEKDVLAAEKKAVEDEKRKLESERNEWKKQRESAAPVPRAKDADNLTSDDYERYAKHFQNEGDEDNARLCKERAEKLRVEDRKLEGQHRQQGFERQLRDNITEIREQFQKEFKQDILDANSEAGKGIYNILERAPELKAFPVGVKYAAEVWKLQQAGSKVPELEKTVTAQKAEIETLRKKLSVGGSQASDSRDYGEKDFNSMSSEERRSFLRKKMNQ